MIIDPNDLNNPVLVGATETGHARLHFSQLGEDAVLWHLFQGKRDGFYIDVGCHHPFRFSNTAVFSNFYGWRGLNIDVDATLIAEFDRARPQDRNVCAAVGSERGTAEVTFFHEAAVNSLDPVLTERFKQTFEARETRIVDVLPLRDIVAANIPPGTPIDLLSIDVEGLDYDVLCSHDWDGYRPNVVAIEAHDIDLGHVADSRIYQFLTGKGYAFNSHIVVTSIYSLI